MTRRQRLAMVVAAATVPVVMTCAGRPWQWVLAGCGASALFFGLLYILMRELLPQGDLCQAAAAAFGPWAALPLGLGAAWTLFAAADTAAQCVSAFPEGEADVLAPAALLILVGLAGWKGELTAARCAGVLAPLLLGLYGLILLAALPSAELQWAVPWGDWRQSAGVLAAMLFPTAALYVGRRSESREKGPGGALAALVLVPAVFAVVTAGVLSPQLAGAQPFAFYTLTKSVSALGVMERFEPVLSAGLYLGFFCLTALLIASAAAQVKAAWAGIGGPWLQPVLCAAAFGLTFLLRWVPEVVRPVGAAIFWGVGPVFTLLVVAIKKLPKNPKKTEKSA